MHRNSHGGWKWNKDAVTEAIRALDASGKKLDVTSVLSRGERALYVAAIRYFGSWSKAIQASGFSYDRIGRCRPWRSWNKATVVRIIRERHRQGLPLNQTSIRKDDSALFFFALRFFGKSGWRKALHAAGIDSYSVMPCRGSKRVWTKKKVIEQILALSRSGSPLCWRHLNRNGYSRLVTAGRKRFGSWERAIRAAGLDYDLVRLIRHRWWTRKRITAAIRRLEHSGILLSNKAMHDSYGDLYSAALKQFGDWGSAVEAAGFDYRLHCRTWSYKAWLRRLDERQFSAITKQADSLAKKRRASHR